MAELVSTATAAWQGGLADGSGTVSLASGAAGPLPVSWASRTEAANGKTSPEELIGAAHAACFSMALSHEIARRRRHAAGQLDVTAKVTFVAGEDGVGISGVALTVSGSADGPRRRRLPEGGRGGEGRLPGVARAGGADHAHGRVARRRVGRRELRWQRRARQ